MGGSEFNFKEWRGEEKRGVGTQIGSKKEGLERLQNNVLWTYPNYREAVLLTITLEFNNKVR